MNLHLIKKLVVVLPLLLLISLSGCKNKNETAENEMQANNNNIEKAVAVIRPLNNSKVHGIVYFNKVSNGIEVIADIEGLSQGKHGFHIHEFGDLRSEDGTSAGGHFNPYGKHHGAPGSDDSHAGDLGNIVAPDSLTTAHYEYTSSAISFSGAGSIIGRCVIIHADEDDLTSQPSGNAGKRIAGVVIGVANPMFNSGS